MAKVVLIDNCADCSLKTEYLTSQRNLQLWRKSSDGRYATLVPSEDRRINYLEGRAYEEAFSLINSRERRYSIDCLWGNCFNCGECTHPLKSTLEPFGSTIFEAALPDHVGKGIKMAQFSIADEGQSVELIHKVQARYLYDEIIIEK